MVTDVEVEHRYKLWEQGYWEIPDNLDTTNFDFSWRPDKWDRPYIHQFGTQWQKTGGPRFVIPENEGIKYQSHQHAIRLPDSTSRSWRPLVKNVSMDYSWHPDDTDPPFIYVFGNQWYDSEIMPTIQYRVKGATEKKYIKDVKATLTPDRTMWEIPDNIGEFDFSWTPHPFDPAGFNYQFGTQWQKTGGPLYKTENSHTIKYVDYPVAIKLPNKENRCWRPLIANIDFDWSWHPDDNDPPFIYVFGNQHYDYNLMPTLLYRVKGATEKKYMDLKVTLLPNYDKFEKLIDDEIEFDYSWVPHPHDPPLSYIFGNQWYDSKTMPTIKYIGKSDDIKHVDDTIATIKSNPKKFKILEPITDFDYSWRPNPNDPPYNYIFGNEYHTAEFMPTVMYRVPMAKDTKYITDKTATLAIEKRNFVDSIFDEVINFTFTTRYAHFQNTQHPINYKMFIPKYDVEKKYIHIIDNHAAIVPKDVRQHMFDKLTDYPYVIHHNCGTQSQLLDIVFFSNGEACAEENYQHLLSLNLPNRIVRVDKVQGRVASQYAAANSSNTPWYFLINAKLKVNPNFDFNWQPNIMQSRRHYIFKATNIVNNLEYGHMAIVANNKILTLQTKGYGLDFTMDSPTEVVDMNCGLAVFNSSEYDTWRTAFREVIKLCYAKDVESNERLEIWLNVGHGSFSEYSLRGARHAVDYFNNVQGDFDKLKLSYDWEWLRDMYNSLYTK